MEKKLVPEMKDAIKEVLYRAKATQSPKIGKLYPEAISELASCVATLKGNVHRDHN